MARDELGKRVLIVSVLRFFGIWGMQLLSLGRKFYRFQFDEWSHDDRVVFQNAFNHYGKNFRIIQKAVDLFESFDEVEMFAEHGVFWQCSSEIHPFPFSA